MQFPRVEHSQHSHIGLETDSGKESDRRENRKKSLEYKAGINPAFTLLVQSRTLQLNKSGMSKFRSVKKMRWKNLINSCCPACGKQLRKVEFSDFYICIEPCAFKIGERVMKGLMGYGRSETGKGWYVDGFLRGMANPSPFGGGWVITDEAGVLVEKINVECLGFTNNDAEIGAIQHCLNLCSEGDEIFTDSRVAELWVKSGKTKARQDLGTLLTELNAIMHQKKVAITWIPREKNLAGIMIEKSQIEAAKIRKEKKTQTNEVVQPQEEQMPTLF